VSVGQPARAARRDASGCFLQTVLRARRGRMPSRTRGAGAGAGLNGSKGAGAGVGSHPPGGGEELADVEDVEVARPARGGQGVVGLGREKDTLNGSDQRRGRCCGVGGTRVRWGNGSWGWRARHSSRKRRGGEGKAQQPEKERGGGQGTPVGKGEPELVGVPLPCFPPDAPVSRRWVGTGRRRAVDAGPPRDRQRTGVVAQRGADLRVVGPLGPADGPVARPAPALLAEVAPQLRAAPPA